MIGSVADFFFGSWIRFVDFEMALSRLRFFNYSAEIGDMKIFRNVSAILQKYIYKMLVKHTMFK